MSILHVLGAFNILVGILLVLGILFMGNGAVLWVTRLGTYNTFRDDAIRSMQWAVRILFVLIVLSIVVKFVTENLSTALFLLGVGLVLVILFVLMKTYVPPHAKKEEEEH